MALGWCYVIWKFDSDAILFGEIQFKVKDILMF